MLCHHRPRLVSTFVIAIVSTCPLMATRSLRADEQPQSPQRRAAKSGHAGLRKAKSDWAIPIRMRAQHQYELLHQTIIEKLELTREERTRIDDVFADVHFQLETGRGSPAAITDVDGAKVLQAARTKVPTALRNEADRARFKAAANGRGGSGAISPMTPHRVVVDAVSQILGGGANLQKFLKLAARWDALQPRPGVHDGPLMRLRRSTLDPALGLTGSDAEDFQIMIGTRMRELVHDRFDDDKTTPAADELRSKILERLTPRQQEHLIATNRALDEDAKLLQEKIAKAEAEAKRDAAAAASKDASPAGDKPATQD